jgi:hypothetical protein
MLQNAIGPEGVQLDYWGALLDAQSWEQEYGQPVVIHVRAEGNVARDAYNSIIGAPTDATTLVQNAATIDYSPTRYKLEKANLREECEVSVWIAMQDLVDAGLEFDSLDISRMHVDVGAIPGEAAGSRYEVKEKSRAGAFGNGYLYVTLGLRRG